jgi:hypothetical protein
VGTRNSRYGAIRTRHSDPHPPKSVIKIRPGRTDDRSSPQPLTDTPFRQAPIDLEIGRNALDRPARELARAQRRHAVGRSGWQRDAAPDLATDVRFKQSRRSASKRPRTRRADVLVAWHRTQSWRRTCRAVSVSRVARRDRADPPRSRDGQSSFERFGPLAFPRWTRARAQPLAERFRRHEMPDVPAAQTSSSATSTSFATLGRSARLPATCVPFTRFRTEKP